MALPLFCPNSGFESLEVMMNSVQDLSIRIELRGRQPDLHLTRKQFLDTVPFQLNTQDHPISVPPGILVHFLDWVVK